MKEGALVRWLWWVTNSWESAEWMGVIVGSRMAKTDYEKIRIFSVLASDGTVLEIREDVEGLEVLA
jgi:hypothetical protein